MNKNQYYPRGIQSTKAVENELSNGSMDFSDAECDDVDEMIVISGNVNLNLG